MANDDYFVLAYRLLSYLYGCLKSGEEPDWERLNYETKEFPVGEDYWNYLLEHLLLDGYVEGAALLPAVGGTQKRIKLSRVFQITPKGIEYLQENSAMRKAAEFLKTLKQTIPGI